MDLQKLKKGRSNKKIVQKNLLQAYMSIRSYKKFRYFFRTLDFYIKYLLRAKKIALNKYFQKLT